MTADHAVFKAFGLPGAHAVRAPGNIDHGFGERFVQRHGGVGEPTDASFIAQCLLQRLAEYDRGVLHRMMRIDVGVAMGMNGQVDQRMLAQCGHHMVVERHGRIDIGFAGTVKVEFKFDMRFAGFANDACGSCHIALLTADCILRPVPCVGAGLFYHVSTM